MLDSWIGKTLRLTYPYTRAALETAQLKAFNSMLSYARSKSPFYRDLLPETCLSSFNELDRIPFTYPEDIRRSASLFVCVPADSIERVFSVLETSGSTGKAKRIYFTADEQELTIDYFHHGMMEFASAGDTAFILFPGSAPGSMNDLLMQALSRMDVSSVLFGLPCKEEYKKTLERILDSAATYLIGPPFILSDLASFSMDCGLDHIFASRIKGVLAAGSFVSDEYIGMIRKAWHCHVDEEYGMTETGLAGAVGCRAGGGYHPWESGLLYEIIDPVTEKRVPDGTEGEVVVTTLNRRCMPLIRYRTGDISHFIPGTCRCGSVLKHMARIGDRHCEKKYMRPKADFF